MPLDASIYQAVKPTPINLPNPVEYAETGMKLSALGMQQAQMQRQLQQQQSLRDAYAKNTDPQTGQLNQQGFLSSLGQDPLTAPLAMEYGKTFAESSKAQAEAQSAQLDAKQKIVGMTFPKIDYLMNLPEDERAKATNVVMKQLEADGAPMQNVPKDSQGNYLYDPSWLKQTYGVLSNEKQALEQRAAQAGIANTQSGTAKNYSEIDKNKAETGQVTKKTQTDYQKMLLDHPDYKEATASLTQGNNILSAVDDAADNPQSRQALPLMVARFSAEGKRMPQDQVEKAALAGDLGDKMKQVFTDVKGGVLTPESQMYIRQLVATQQASAAKNKFAVENDIAGKYAIDQGLSQKDAYSKLTGYPTAKPTQTMTPPMSANRSQQAGTASDKPAPKFNPGAIVMDKSGKHYRVGADGDSLEPIQGKGK